MQSSAAMLYNFSGLHTCNMAVRFIYKYKYYKYIYNFEKPAEKAPNCGTEMAAAILAPFDRDFFPNRVCKVG